jgi:hypothetical protein
MVYRYVPADMQDSRDRVHNFGSPDPSDFMAVRAKSWNQERRVVARIEASASHEDDMLRRGIDIRYIVTSVKGHEPEHSTRPWLDAS